MDYSQFLIMRGEISLLLVFLLIFLFDTLREKRASKDYPLRHAFYSPCIRFGI